MRVAAAFRRGRRLRGHRSASNDVSDMLAYEPEIGHEINRSVSVLHAHVRASEVRECLPAPAGAEAQVSEVTMKPRSIRPHMMQLFEGAHLCQHFVGPERRVAAVDAVRHQGRRNRRRRSMDGETNPQIPVRQMSQRLIKPT